MQQGWICLHRSILDNQLWQEKRTFSRGEAWIDLLLMVNHEEKRVLINGKSVLVKAGERLTSIAQLAERWDWSRWKVTAFLKFLQDEDMITYKTTSKYTLVTIVKWGFYQNSVLANQHQNDNKPTSNQHQNDTNNNDNNIYTGGGGRIRAREDYSQVMSLEVGAEESADDHPIHAQEIIIYAGRPTTAYEAQQIQTLTERLFDAYRTKPPTEADVARVFEYVYRVEVLDDDRFINICDDDKVELLEYAFQQAFEGGQTSWNYIGGIYKNFDRRGIRTVEDARNYAFKRNTGMSVDDFMNQFYE